MKLQLTNKVLLSLQNRKLLRRSVEVTAGAGINIAITKIKVKGIF